MALRIGTGDIRKFVVELNAAAKTVPAGTAAVVAEGAVNIKKGMRDRVQGLRHAPAYPSSIGYDMTVTRWGARAEIGPDKDKRQGALGNLINYGSVNNAPTPHVEPAAADELPRFEAAMQALAERPLGR